MADEQIVYRNGNRIKSLYHCVRNSTTLELIPDLLKQIIREEMWRAHFHEPTQKSYSCKSFREFVEVAPPQGLGTTIDTLLVLCRDDTEAQELIDKETQGKVGAPIGSQNAKKEKKLNVDNINNYNQSTRPTGTSKQYGLRKLRKYAETHPEVESLHQMALQGEMSVNMALVKAGLRSKSLTIPNNPSRAAKTIKKFFGQEEIDELIWCLQHPE